MEKWVSNNFLGTLVLLWMIVLSVGIILASKGHLPIIGYVTNTTSGTANVSIQTITTITLNNNSIDFGTGFVNSTDVACVLESNSSNRMNSTQGITIHACDKAGGGPGFNAPAITAYMVVSNDANSNITLTINSSFFCGAQCPANVATGGFLCNVNSTLQNCTFANPEYNWSASTFDAAAACTSDNGFSSRSRFNQSLNGTQQIVCANMDFNPAQHKVQVALRLKIPRDSKQGLLNDSILFEGTS